MSTKKHPLMPLVRHAVTRTTPLTEAVCRLGWALARTDDDVELMTQLAYRSELPADVRAALAQVKDVHVRVAYLKRPDLSAEERQSLLATETRAKVLAVLASDSECDPGTLDALATHQTVTVLLAVIANEGAPAEVRRKAVFSLVTSGKEVGKTQRKVVDAFIKDDDDGHDEYARTLPATYLPLLVQSEHVQADGLRRIANVLLTSRVARTLAYPDAWQRQNSGNRLVAAASALLLIADLPSDAIDAIEQALASLGAVPEIANGTSYQQAQARLIAKRSGPLAADLALARSSTDPVELAALVRIGQDKAVCGAIARNRASSPETTVAAVLHGTVNIGRVLEARAGQDDVLLALWSSAAGTRNFFKVRTFEGDLGLAMLTADVPAHAKRDLARRMLHEKILPDKAAALLPPAAFEGALHSARGEVSLGDLGVEVLCEGLDDDIPAELIAVVASDFSGSLAELIDTCRLLSSAEQAN